MNLSSPHASLLFSSTNRYSYHRSCIPPSSNLSKFFLLLLMTSMSLDQVQFQGRSGRNVGGGGKFCSKEIAPPPKIILCKINNLLVWPSLHSTSYARGGEMSLPPPLYARLLLRSTNRYLQHRSIDHCLLHYKNGSSFLISPPPLPIPIFHPQVLIIIITLYF